MVVVEWLRREQAPFSLGFGLEKQHLDLDRTMQFLGAGEGLQGTGRHFWGVMAPIAMPALPPLRISLRRNCSKRQARKLMTMQSCPYIAKTCNIYHISSRFPILQFLILLSVSSFQNLTCFETFPAIWVGKPWRAILLLAAKMDWCGCYRSPLPVPEKGKKPSPADPLHPGLLVAGEISISVSSHACVLSLPNMIR